MPRAKRWHPSQESDELIFAVCDRFLAQLGQQFDSHDNHADREKRGAAAAIAHWLKVEWGRADLTREKVYPLFWEAARRNFLFLQAPREKQLALRLAGRFGVTRPEKEDDTVQVVDTVGPEAPRHVTSAGADLILSLVERLAQKRNADKQPGEELQPIHIGMGAGFATMMVAKRLAERVHDNVDCPPLVLHALSAGGFLVNEPQKAPVTYFSYFEGALAKVEYVALFAEMVVSSKTDYEQVKRNPGVRRSFERKQEIDIVVTSLAAAQHEHGLLVKFLTHLVEEGVLGSDVFDRMEAVGWKGDVQFRPYTAEGPLTDACPVRAVTLFELPELVRMAATEDKYVVLLGGPCGECGQSKRDSLVPLLAEPNLRLWTHLVTDAQTARELLQ